jgi:hypothetical protein
MTGAGHTQIMADTGEKREIARFVSAKEAKTIQESKKLISKAKQQSAKTAQENRSRKRRSISPGSGEKPRETEDDRRVQGASERMVDEGSPIHVHE